MRLLFDVETNGFLEVMTTIHCIETVDIDTGETRHFGPDQIDEGVAHLDQADMIIGHNIIKFDVPAINKIYPKWVCPPVVRDTMILARLIWADSKDLKFKDIRRIKSSKTNMPMKIVGKQTLEAWGYRLGLNKGEFGKSTDWQQWSQEMSDYCAQDVQVNLALWRLIVSKAVSQESVELEHEFATIIAMQESFGFMLDVPACHSLVADLCGKRDAIKSELQDLIPARIETMKSPAWYSYLGKQFDTIKDIKAKYPKASRKEILTGPARTKQHLFNPGSDKQVADYLIKEYKWKPSVFTDGGAPSITEEVLEGLDYPSIPKLIEYAVVDKRLSQISEGRGSWLKYVKEDGRVYGGVITNGCVTGRCSHIAPNMGQVPSSGSPYGKECRALWTAPEGWALVGCDASGLEARCLAHFMARYDNGDYTKVVLGGDIHSVNQEAAGLPTRDMAKTFFYGFMYGAGDGKIGSIVKGGKAQGKKLREKFLRGLPALEQLITKVKRSCGFSLNDRGYWQRPKTAKKTYLVGLDGRYLEVRSAHSALNTLLQSAGAVAMKQALCTHYRSMLDAGFKPFVDFMYVVNCHDEFQTQVRKGLEDETGRLAVEAIRQAGVHFGFRCPLDAEHKVGKTWKETH